MRCLGLSSLFTLAALAGSCGRRPARSSLSQRRGRRSSSRRKRKSSRPCSPYVPSKGERLAARVENILTGEGKHLHPFFESAYSGGGFAFGAGYMQHVSAYNFVDVRGSYSLSNYKRAEIEFVAPRLFHRRGDLSLLGGWRDATQVGFYGLGTDTSKDDRTNYRFKRPYASGLLTLWPTRRYLLLRGGVEWTKWSQEPGLGRFPSVETVYTPETLPGLGADPTYVHTQATVGFDWRTSPGYSRRGGYYGITGHDYNDRDKAFGFQQVEYEAIQHFPVLRETWVFSFRARATNHAREERSGDPVLHAALPWRQFHAAGLFEPAVPRSEQPAPPGGVAHHGQPLSRLGGVLRCRQGDRAPIRSRLRRAEARLRLRTPFSRADLYAAPHRVGQGQ